MGGRHGCRSEADGKVGNKKTRIIPGHGPLATKAEMKASGGHAGNGPQSLNTAGEAGQERG